MAAQKMAFHQKLTALFTILSLLELIEFHSALPSDGGCPDGNLLCRVTGTCVLQRSICDGKPDCPDRQDEEPVFCADLHGVFWHLVESLTYKKLNSSCDVDEVSLGCTCTEHTVVVCIGLELQEVPVNISQKVTRMILRENNITLVPSSFDHYSLKLIHLGRNGMTYMPKDVLSKQSKLEKLFLSENSLTELPEGMFDGVEKLKWLFANDNHLKFLHYSNWKLGQLSWLELSRNRLSLKGENFPHLPSLLFLSLDSNEIEEITEKCFSNLPALKELTLRRNKIKIIHPLAFRNQLGLYELDLAYNELQMLYSGVFSSTGNLTKLNLGGNPLKKIRSHLFNPISSLRSLDLQEIDIEVIDIGIFLQLQTLDFVYFKKFKYCSYAPRVQKCKPNTDGVSSLNDLLAERLVRATLWVVAGFIFLTNSLVLWRRLKSTAQISPLNLVITNLAVSDMLMGVYLGIIGWHDIRYRGVYKDFAHQWTSSWLCTIAGITAMLSSEVSVLILLLISAERFLLIASPLSGHKSLSLKTAVSSVITIWVFVLLVAIIPVIEWKHTMRFYGTNSLCFPLHIDEPYLVGWQYSAFVFIGLNSAGMIGIAILYSGVFFSIWKTRKATTLNVPDSDFALRFLFIVITNACCWVPIIILKAMAFMNHTISGEFYSWLVVFVLPINSAVNPILYTFTTPNYRSMLHHIIKDRQNSNQDGEPMRMWGNIRFLMIKRNQANTKPPTVVYPPAGTVEEENF